MMVPLYEELRKELDAYGIDDEYLAEQLEISDRSLRSRFRNVKGRTWRLEEQYKILRMIGKPDNQLAFYFPRYPLREVPRP